MREVAILGAGLHPWGSFPEKTYDDLLVHAAMEALKDANIEWKDLQFIVAGICPFEGLSGLMTASVLSENVGQLGIPMINTFNACATGAGTMSQAYQAVASGQYDLVLAIAADKFPGGFYPGAMGARTKDNLDLVRFEMAGLPNPGYFALHMRRRMEEYGDTEEDMAQVKVQCSKYSPHNPNARYRKPFTIEDVLGSPYVCSPLRLYEICATSDGAAAMVLASMDIAKARNPRPVKVAAATVGTSVYGDPTLRVPTLSSTADHRAPWLSESVQSLKKAYEHAGVGPEDLDVVELCDNSSWHFLEYCELIGLCKKGEAAQNLRSGEFDIGGRVPVCPSSGISSFGEAVPAQLLCGTYELYLQLLGRAGARQVGSPKVGLSQSYGAQGNAGTIILKR
jgi:acetyl-CoA acetyltransferase